VCVCVCVCVGVDVELQRRCGSQTKPKTTECLARHCTEDRVVSTDRRTMLFVGLLGMTHLVELWGGCQHGATEPHGVTLHVMTDDVDSERDGADLTTAQLFTTLDTVVDGALHITLQSLAKVLEHGRATTEHDVLVEATTGINRTALDSVIHHLGQGSEKLGRENLRVEEHLGAEETLVADIHGERTLGHRLDALVLLDPLFRLRIVLLVLTDDIGTHVAVGLLHTLGNLEGLSGRDNTAALTLTLQLLHERRHITTGQRNVLDGTADNITLSLRAQRLIKHNEEQRRTVRNQNQEWRRFKGTTHSWVSTHKVCHVGHST